MSEHINVTVTVPPFFSVDWAAPVPRRRWPLAKRLWPIYAGERLAERFGRRDLANRLYTYGLRVGRGMAR